MSKTKGGETTGGHEGVLDVLQGDFMGKKKKGERKRRRRKKGPSRTQIGRKRGGYLYEH